MRFVFIVLMMVGVMAGSARAEGGGHNFGRMTCSQAVACPNDFSHLPSASALAAAASSCITQYFGYSNSDGFFDSSAGLDGNNCLSAIPNILPKGAGSQLAPSCCIIEQSAGTCAMRCELNTAN